MSLSPKAAAAAATILWGFTYIVTTTMLPQNPMFIAAVRALGGGLPLLLIVRDFPPRAWWGRIIILGTLNNALFFGLLFVAAIRLPGGVAATFQALGPLFMVLLAWPLLGAKPSPSKLAAVGLGAAGVAMVVLKGNASLDLIGILAALGGAFAVALGGGLIHKWGRPSSIISLAAWQMIVAGVELAIAAALLGDIPASLSGINILGLAILALFLTSLAFVLWFTAIAGAGPSAVAPLLLLTPLTAFVLDGLVRGVIPSSIQSVGVAIVIGSLLYGQHVDRRAFRPAHHHAPSARQVAGKRK
ncbi:EamA family transporter (plasmid) [Paracoccus kondratievae]|uniref:DMT family transporter n=1 Tax=Paracoccus kondratievae TaxID=135740 RepID=UPI0012662808|nr:DMT family transporter [Paracoccus kondratievae]QFQ89873.1 EamA family transporter [Paracoccus kondratievae]